MASTQSHNSTPKRISSSHGEDESDWKGTKQRPVDHDLVLPLPYLSSSDTQMFPCQAHTARA